MSSDNGVINIRIQNFKNIEEFQAEFNGKSVFIVADNEVGKSSLMQAIFLLLSNQNLPQNSIKRGEDNALVEADFMVDGKRYTAKRKFTDKNPRGYFEVEGDDGMKSNNLGILEKLVGDISFNPFDFVELSKTAEGRKKQVQFIRKLIPEEINRQIDEVEDTYRQAYEERREVNRKLKDIQVPDFPENPENYREYVDVQSLTEKIEGINKNNQYIDKLDDQVRKYNYEESNLNSEIKELEEKLAAKKQSLEEIEAASAKVQDEIDKSEYQDPGPIKEQINQSSEHNRLVDQLKRVEEAEKEKTEKQRKSEELTQKLNEALVEKHTLINNSNLPVEGLSFDEEGIYLNGLQVNEDQISTSQIMDLGVKIQVAVNPRLKIMKIPRGESLGSAKLEAIKDFISQNGYQAFIEKVEAGEDQLKIRFFDNGEEVNHG